MADHPLPADGGPAGSTWPVLYGASNDSDLPPDQQVDQRFHPAEGMAVVLYPFELTPSDVLSSPLFFQCPPMDEFTVNYAHSHNDYETLDDQHSRAGVPQLAQITFDTLVVDYGSFVVNPHEDEISVITDRLVNVCNSGAPFYFVATHAAIIGDYQNVAGTIAGAEYAFFATMRTLNISEKAGEGDARYLNVAFSEYRDTTITRLGKGQSTRREQQQASTSVRVYWDGMVEDKVGNRITQDWIANPVTLSMLSKHFYRDPSFAHQIAKANDMGSWGSTTPIIEHPMFRNQKSGRWTLMTIPKRGSNPFSTAWGRS